MKSKKLISSLLAISMLASLSTAAFAEMGPPSIDESGGNESVPVTLNVEPAIFSVTVPSVLPVSVTADGEVVCAESGEARIINHSHGAVKVTNLEIDAINGWETVDFDNANMHKAQVNSRLFAFTINNEKTTGADAITFDTANFPVLDGANDTDSDELVIDYDALIAPQNAAVVDMDIANIVFTIAWEEAASRIKFGEKYVVVGSPSEYYIFNSDGSVEMSEDASMPADGWMYFPTEIRHVDMPSEIRFFISVDGTKISMTEDGQEYGLLVLQSSVNSLKFDEAYVVVDAVIPSQRPFGSWITFHEDGSASGYYESGVGSYSYDNNMIYNGPVEDGNLHYVLREDGMLVDNIEDPWTIYAPESMLPLVDIHIYSEDGVIDEVIKARAGVKWMRWVESEYNTIGAYLTEPYGELTLPGGYTSRGQYTTINEQDVVPQGGELIFVPER